MFCFIAGKHVEGDELEEMIEKGNPAIFTQGVINIAEAILCFGNKLFLCR